MSEIDKISRYGQQLRAAKSFYNLAARFAAIFAPTKLFSSITMVERIEPTATRMVTSGAGMWTTGATWTTTATTDPMEAPTAATSAAIFLRSAVHDAGIGAGGGVTTTAATGSTT